MRSDRPYRGARTTEEALAELRRCAGTQFDPGVVANFCAIVAARGQLRATA
jgi:HD-GYP domain-containing protein (c-di-GMP phosphodiesterase class II)